MEGVLEEKYAAYKYAEWHGHIPEEWLVVRFRNFFSFSKGLIITKENLKDRGIPCVNYGEIHSKYGFELDLSKHPLKCVDKELVDHFPDALLTKGDIVFADTSEDIEGSGNFTQLVSEGVVVAGYHTIIARPKPYVNSRFMAYVLDSVGYRDQLRRAVKGVKVYSITKTILKNTLVWFPPLHEQTALASFLDRKCEQIDKAIAIKEKQIVLLKERRQILIHRAVTRGLDPDVKLKDSGVEWIGKIPEHWEVKRLKYLFTLSKGLTITKENLIEIGVPCVNYGEIHSKFGFELNTEKHKLKCVEEAYLKTSSQSLIEEGQFVFADTSEDIEGSGNFTYHQSSDRIFAGYHTIIARPKKELKARFLAYEFDSLAFRSQIRTKVKGVKVFSITQGILKTPWVWLPSKKEQREIVEFLDEKCEEVIKAVYLQQKQIEKLKEYKTSLINAAVTGKVKVK